MLTSPGRGGIPILPEDIPVHVEKQLRVHPRVAYQGRFSSKESRRLLAGQLPKLVPFRGKAYAEVIPVIDWDHKLPSKALLLRLFCFYEGGPVADGVAAFDARVELIAAKDKFPEFDVPDFEDLPADESYEIELDVEGKPGKARLVSDWRREVEDAAGRIAVDVAKASEEFATVLASVGNRPRGLGGLEAVSWVPPCESEHPRWTVDVWYLMQFDGRMGQGRSLVVDTIDKRVITVRDFSVRAGG